MGNQRLRILVLIVISTLALGLTACTRSASTPPSAEEEVSPDTQTSDTQATMDAVRSAILTQTAQASEAEVVGEGTLTVVAPAESPTPTVSGTPPTATPTPTATSSAELEYTVQSGDWIWKIARNFNVDPQDIIDLNGITDPSQLQPGMVLKIPAQAVSTATPTVEGTLTTSTPATGTPQTGVKKHVVMPGEWIWQIARNYGVDPQDIIDANNLSDPAKIYPGQELIIP
jgi:LysM repeat protein